MHWRSLLACNLGAKLFRVMLAVACCSIYAAESAQNTETLQANRNLEDEPRTVQDLRYGVALYNFFQQSYFDALTEIMVGQQLNDFQNHPKQAELLRGGMSLSYGMVDEAESVFTRLLQTPSDSIDHQKNQAWFYLAKLQYQFDQTDKARNALKESGQLTDKALMQERYYMMANLALREGDFATAEQHIQQLESDSVWLPYYYFNRGIALTRQGNWQQGVLAFQQLTELPANIQETKHLKDRAYTAAGYAYLAGEQFELAQQQFRQVRRDSLFVQRALLGYGWAAAQQEDYTTALSPWQTLRNYSLMETSVQESLLAIPFAYEKLGAPGNALLEYQQSIQLLDNELHQIENAITVYSTTELQSLFEWQSDSSIPVQDWFADKNLMLDGEYTPYLSYLVTRQRFQDRLMQLSELYRLQQFLSRAEQRLISSEVTLEERAELWRKKIDSNQQATLNSRYQQLMEKERKLRQLLEQAEHDADGLLLMSSEEKAIWQRVQAADEKLAMLEGTELDQSEKRQKLDFFKGLLIWQFNESYHDRIWQAKKQVDETSNLLGLTQPAIQRVDAISESPNDQGFSDRITEIKSRLLKQKKVVVQQIDQVESRVKGLAITALEQQRERLNSYKGQAMLAIARLHDLGNPDIGITVESMPSSESTVGEEQ